MKLSPNLQNQLNNATTELYNAKGSRLVFFNEPENDGDNKLQVA